MDPTTAAMAAAYGYNGTTTNGLFSDLNHSNEVGLFDGMLPYYTVFKTAF